MAAIPALHLEELNVKYPDEKSAKYAYRARVAGGWMVFTSKGGLGGVTFYPDPDHTWDGGTQEVGQRANIATGKGRAPK